MSAMPRAVLSDQLEERIRGRRLLAGVFLSFQFDPAFFENQILPLFFDLSTSLGPKLRLIQLSDALETVPDGVAVYYDRRGLVPGAGCSRLDIRRIAVPPRQAGYIFHPKNILALVEDAEENKDGSRAKTLIVATLSANLTDSGWWKNVEVCHVEEIDKFGFTSLRADLMGFLNDLERRTASKSGDDHKALRAILDFLRQTEDRKQRSVGGRLYTRFYDGRSNVSKFIWDIAGKSLRGMNLEIISPFFDDTFLRLPLHQLIERFEPREIRIYLPRNESGDVTCTRSVYEGIRRMEKHHVFWSKLPVDLLRSGRSADARPRDVHAKVYRFFRQSPRREVFFTGSVNLTSAAHHSASNPRMGNDETAILFETVPDRKPDWLLEPEASRPVKFTHQTEVEGAGPENGTDLSLRFNWDSGVGQAYWDSKDPAPSPALTIKGLGAILFRLDPLAPMKWTRLVPAAEAELRRVLQSTSILTVEEIGKEPAYLLVQEEGMQSRPPLLLDLTPAEILRYWALLTLAQKSEFLKARAPELAQTEEGADLLVQVERLAKEETFFDTFAGIFHSFGSLEQSIRESLPDNPKPAVCRLFGHKYDALPVLLRKIAEASERGQGDPTDQYLNFLCARQLIDELRRTHPDFFRTHRGEANELENQIGQGLLGLRKRLAETVPDADMFLKWFEKWFLPRAKPVIPKEDEA